MEAGNPVRIHTQSLALDLGAPAQDACHPPPNPRLSHAHTLALTLTRAHAPTPATDSPTSVLNAHTCALVTLTRHSHTLSHSRQHILTHAASLTPVHTSSDTPSCTLTPSVTLSRTRSHAGRAAPGKGWSCPIPRTFPLPRPLSAARLVPYKSWRGVWREDPLLFLLF